MEKITDYFILITGGKFLWQHINRTAIKNYIFYSSIFAFLAILFSFLISPTFYAIFFLIVSLFLIASGVSAFHIEIVKNYILKSGSTTEDAKYTLFFLIYIGLCGLLLTIYTLSGWPAIKI